MHRPNAQSRTIKLDNYPLIQHIPCEKVCGFGSSYSHMPNIYHEAQSLSKQKPENSEVS